MIIKPSPNKEGSWVIGEYRFSPDSISRLTTENRYCKEYRLFESHIAEIQDHVRKHSAPPAKRTASDAQNGDEAWILDYVTGQVLTGRIQNLTPGDYLEVRVGENVFMRFFGSYGESWGLGKGPDSAAAGWTTTGSAAEGKPLPPQLGNVALLIKAKGLEWVKANAPDAWDAYKAADINKVREEAKRLNKPGPLAGKVMRLE